MEPSLADAPRPPLKILRVIARLNVGGPARHVVLLDRGLRARGHDTLLVHGSVGTGEGSLEQLAASSAVPLLKLASLGPRLNPLNDARAFLDLLLTTFRVSPDVIHSHTAKAGTLARLSAALYNATRRKSRRALVVHTFHGHVLEGYFSPVGNLLVRLIERSLGHLTDCIVAISPRQRHDLVDRFRVASARQAVTIPIGLDLTPLLESRPGRSQIRDALGIPDGDAVVGYVGRFVPIKDLPTLVAAFAAIVRDIPNAWLLLIGDGPARGDVESAARAAGVSERLRITGWVDDLPAIYAAIDVCVLSSLNEGTPVALIEAMAAAKPVVSTAVGGVPDVIEDGVTGMLVSPRLPEALANAVVELLRDAPARMVMGNAARQAVAGRFSQTRLVDEIDRLYAQRLEGKRGPTRRRRDTEDY
jgi:glycosyltransferase involved in cell wall biosynthesis